MADAATAGTGSGGGRGCRSGVRGAKRGGAAGVEWGQEGGVGDKGFLQGGEGAKRAVWQSRRPPPGMAAARVASRVRQPRRVGARARARRRRAFNRALRRPAGLRRRHASSSPFWRWVSVLEGPRKATAGQVGRAWPHVAAPADRQAWEQRQVGKFGRRGVGGAPQRSLVRFLHSPGSPTTTSFACPHPLGSRWLRAVSLQFSPKITYRMNKDCVAFLDYL